MARATAADLPEVTEAHRLAAFEAMRWTGWTFEAAMADDTRRRVIEARAHQVRTQLWRSERRPLRYCATTGKADWLRDSTRRFWPVSVQDLKRAASGDRDD